MCQNITREFIDGKRGSPRGEIVAKIGLSSQKSAFMRGPRGPVWTRNGLQSHKWIQGLHDVAMCQTIIREFIDGKRGSPRKEAVAQTCLFTQKSAFMGIREVPCGPGMACKHTNGSRGPMTSTCVKTSEGNS